MSNATVVGGGIVGICCALALQEAGYKVDIFEKEVPGSGATRGNCGLLAVGEVVPISKPGVLAKVPGWLLDPQAPLFVRARALVTELPWLLRFLWAGRVVRAKEIARDLAQLTSRAQGDFETLLGKAGLASNLIAAENLIVFDRKSDFENDCFSWDLRRSLGFEHEFLSRDDLHRIEPELGDRVTCGLLLKRWLHFSDPYLMAGRLADFFVSRGGRIRKADVAGIAVEGNRASAVLLRGGDTHRVDTLVLAAGAWSGALASDIGLRLPLAALQGYHFHVPNPGIQLSRAVIYANGGFVATPMESGLRLAGTIEVGGHDPKPDFGRARVLAARAKTLLPNADLSTGTNWMGPRPFMPDTLPVIGRAPHQDNVLLAFGHGQVGVTLAATTGMIIADLAAGLTPSVDIHPYRATRF